MSKILNTLFKNIKYHQNETYTFIQDEIRFELKLVKKSDDFEIYEGTINKINHVFLFKVEKNMIHQINFNTDDYIDPHKNIKILFNTFFLDEDSGNISNTKYHYFIDEYFEKNFDNLHHFLGNESSIRLKYILEGKENIEKRIKFI